MGLNEDAVRELEAVLKTGTRTIETLSLLAHCKLALDNLRKCEDRTKIPRFLRKSIPFAHKTGYVGDVRTDAGILYGPQSRIVIAVLTAENADQSDGENNAAEILAGRRPEVDFPFLGVS